MHCGNTGHTLRSPTIASLFGVEPLHAARSKNAAIRKEGMLMGGLGVLLPSRRSKIGPRRLVELFAQRQAQGRREPLEVPERFPPSRHDDDRLVAIDRAQHLSSEAIGIHR